VKRLAAILALALLAVPFLIGCEPTDRSYATSPSLTALIGTNIGNVAFRIDKTPPAPKDPPPGWALDFSRATFSRLENGQPTLQFVLQVRTQAGAGFELWLVDEDRELVARWSAGATSGYVGVVCFQLELARDGEAVPLGTGEHHAIAAFRTFGGELVVASATRVTGNLPALEGVTPAQGSPVYRDALACPGGL
jgi:hypothetical protein